MSVCRTLSQEDLQEVAVAGLPTHKLMAFVHEILAKGDNLRAVYSVDLKEDTQRHLYQ